jgi:hypothetical protein
MGRIKPKIVLDLMDVANKFADGEDACNNKRTRSLMSTHASVLVDSVGPPSAEVCRTAASFP